MATGSRARAFEFEFREEKEASLGMESSFLQDEEVSHRFIPDGSVSGGSASHVWANVKIGGGSSIEIQCGSNRKTAGTFACDACGELGQCAG